jgi:hypothetical protein
MYTLLSVQIYFILHSAPRVYEHLGYDSMLVSVFFFNLGLLICDKSKYERSKYISSHVYGTGYRLLPFVVAGQLKLIIEAYRSFNKEKFI